MSENSPLQICLTTMQGTWDNMSRVANAVEQNGLYGVGIADSPMVERDMHLACAAAALSTNNTKIVTGVTNPVTRHPSVMASAFAQLEELAPDRVVCGIATGDSALWGVGLKPAKLADLREYILTLKALLRGEEAHWQGNSFRANWSQFEPFDLPVYVACAGPKSMRMAAQVADGLIVCVGVAPGDLAWINETIAASCAEIGRNPDELDIWHYTEITFAENAAVAAQNSLGWFSHWLTLGGTSGKRIPEEYKPLLAQLNVDTENIDAAYSTEGRGAIMVKRAKELGIYDWLATRSPRLWGTPREVRERLDALSALGATKWMLFPDGMTMDDIEVASRLGKVQA
jgi:5,10-methylenetetrahydromethanopterin reductase